MFVLFVTKIFITVIFSPVIDSEFVLVGHLTLHIFVDLFGEEGELMFLIHTICSVFELGKFKFILCVGDFYYFLVGNHLFFVE